jgi:formylglycine-generating enzyme required for sulfatase activity
MTVDGMQFCLVPGGPFRMGEGDNRHTNAHLTADYWLGRYPVTNAQFMTFVDDGGYDNRNFWGEAEKAQVWRKSIVKDWFGDERTRPRDYSLPNHPVVGITWYEALAFTRWLTERWRKNGMIGTDWEIKLPSEAEWEKGARGGLAVPAAPVVRVAGDWAAAAPAMTPNPNPERRHPWTGPAGTHQANTRESTINSTSAAGLFPAGASPYGCEEMAGTVWEWTRSLWAFKYPYVPDAKRENLEAGDREARVLRGGSYFSELDECRCAQRNWYNPLDGYDNYGLRALVAPSGHL